MGVRKATEEERDGKKRAGWRERIESLKKKTQTESTSKFANCITCGIKV